MRHKNKYYQKFRPVRKDVFVYTLIESGLKFKLFNIGLIKSTALIICP
jgi:hypothetical protein